MKTIGLSYMAYWGDQFEDIASGNNFFLADLVLELDRRGYKVFALQEDLDKQQPVFKNFLENERSKAYNLLEFTKDLPDLDIVWIEWRWKMDGRNWNGPDCRNSVPMDDYYRQMEILEHYHDHTDAKVFIMDSDHKMTQEDEERWNKATILSLDLFPEEGRNRTYVYWPFDSNRLLERESLVHETFKIGNDVARTTDPNFILSYIGNNYERDNEFERWLGQISQILGQNRVQVYGNWTKYTRQYLNFVKKYFAITFHPKVTKAEMEYIYSRSTAVPLLAKDSYNEYGHMTHRLLEAMYCGTIPVGFSGFNGIKKYLIDELIVNDVNEFHGLISKLQQMSLEERIDLWKKQVQHFNYGPGDFIDVLEHS